MSDHKDQLDLDEIFTEISQEAAERKAVYDAERAKAVSELVGSNEEVFDRMKAEAEKNDLSQALVAVAGIHPFGVVIQFPLGEFHRLLTPLQTLKLSAQLTETALLMIDQFKKPDMMEELRQCLKNELNDAPDSIKKQRKSKEEKGDTDKAVVDRKKSLN